MGLEAEHYKHLLRDEQKKHDLTKQALRNTQSELKKITKEYKAYKLRVQVIKRDL